MKYLFVGIFVLYSLATFCHADIQLSKLDALILANKIWQNEGNGTDQYLTQWNEGETFASLGMGHFIWYPANISDRPYIESFTKLLTYLKEDRVELPHGITPNTPCLWPSRTAFYQDFDTPKMYELRQFLKTTFSEQAQFIVLRLNQSLPQIIAVASKNRQSHIKNRFETIVQTPNGIYALMDYVNFKGEGVFEKEHYQGYGWGLLQVLDAMPEKSKNNILADFVRAADFVLTRRVRYAPKEENQWLEGWRKRLQTYLNTGEDQSRP
jgi:hypothetical protein